MAEVITGAGVVLGGITTWAGSTVTFIGNNPLILFPVLVAFAFVGVRIVKSMVRGV